MICDIINQEVYHLAVLCPHYERNTTPINAVRSKFEIALKRFQINYN